jgi:hypothetical protein
MFNFWVGILVGGFAGTLFGGLMMAVMNSATHADRQLEKELAHGDDHQSRVV